MIQESIQLHIFIKLLVYLEPIFTLIINCFVTSFGFRLTSRIPFRKHIMTLSEETPVQASAVSQEEEQVVNIEHVEAKDNKGIDYDKLIGKSCL